MLKNFPYWAGAHDLPVSPKFHKFEAPDQAVGANALTAAELLTLAGLDFYPEAARQRARSRWGP